MALLLHLLTVCQPGTRESEMPKAILNCGPDSIYDDELPYRYHFVEKHRKELTRCLRDEVIFYEPKRAGGRKAYTASAKIVAIYPDNEKPIGNYYAILDGFKYFDRLVPHMVEGRYLESNGLTSDGQFTARKSVRYLNDEEFNRILELGGALA